MSTKIVNDKIRNIAIAVGIALSSSVSAFADDSFIVNTDSIGKSQNGAIMSDQLLELGSPSSDNLRLEGEQSLRFGNLDKAIMVLQRSVELEPMDLDGRIMYAGALEKKLRRQKDRDPKLFNFVVKQWLFVAKKSEFEDQITQALGHVQELTGTIPKRWESERKFLNRVMIPEDGSVKVAIGGKHDSDN